MGLFVVAGLLQLGACRSSSPQAKKETTRATLASALVATAPSAPVATAPMAPTAAAPKAPPAGGWVRLPPRPSVPLSASIRVFIDAAKQAQEDPAAERWLREALDEGKVTRLASPVPASVQRAAAALRTWAASGEAVSIGARSYGAFELMDAFNVAFALIVTVERSDAPMAAALLRFSQALRAPSNTTTAIAAGAGLAADLAAHVLQQRHQPVTEPFRTHAPTEQDALNLGRSSVTDSVELARLVTLEELQRGPLKHPAVLVPRDGTKDFEVARLEELSTAAGVAAAREAIGLPITGDWLADEFAHYRTFWDETEHLAATAKTAAEMASVLEARSRLALIHPTSTLVRLVGDVTLSNHESALVLHVAERARTYQALLAAAAAAK